MLIYFFSFLSSQRMALTNWEICQKNYTDLTDEEFDKVFYIEGFCDEPTNVTTSTTSRAYPPSQDVHTAILVYYSFLVFSGIVLNLLVMLTILLRERLRTVPNAFMISLTIADFLMASVIVPLRLSEFLQPNKLSYEITDMLFPLVGVASIYSLCSVTLDRYIHIRNALNYEKYITKFRAILVVAAIWSFAITQGVIVIFMVDKKKEMVYNDARFVVCFCFPGIFIAMAYAKLFLVARGHARAIAAATPMHLDSVRSSHNKDFKILKVVALIVGTFFLCWLPFFVLNSYELHNVELAANSSVFRVLMQTSECLACSTTVFNPLLYGFLRKDLRLSIKNVITCGSSGIEDTTRGS